MLKRIFACSLGLAIGWILVAGVRAGTELMECGQHMNLGAVNSGAGGGIFAVANFRDWRPMLELASAERIWRHSLLMEGCRIGTSGPGMTGGGKGAEAAYEEVISRHRRFRGTGHWPCGVDGATYGPSARGAMRWRETRTKEKDGTGTGTGTGGDGTGTRHSRDRAKVMLYAADFVCVRSTILASAYERRKPGAGVCRPRVGERGPVWS